MARRSPHRFPFFEQCEDRIALTGNTLSNWPSFEGVTQAQDVTQATLISRDVFGVDNTTNTARDLGAINGSIAIRNQYVGPFDNRDVFRFELQRGGEAQIQLRGMTSDADVYLLNSRRETVASSRNASWQPEFIRESLSAGEYFVVVQNYHSWRGTGYALDIDASLDAPPDPIGNTFETAKNLGALQGQASITDAVGEGDEMDVFRFHVESATRFDASLIDLRDDVDLYLFSENGTRLISSDRPGRSSEQIQAWIASGSYYLVVDAYESASSQYTLTLDTGLPPSEPPSDPRPDPTPTTPPATTPPTTTPPTTTPPTNSVPVTPSPPVVAPPQTAPPATGPSGPLTDVPFFGSTSRDWGINSVNAPEAWAAGYAGEGITVAVIDSGVQLSHPDLTHSIWVNAGEIAGDGIDNDGNGYVDDVRGWDFIDRDNNPTDANGHGTHVAGVVAAANNGAGGTGVAYASSIMPIRVLDESGSGSTHGVAQGIRYAVDNGAQIINLSLGGGNSQSVYSALQYAEQNNVLVVAASGNESGGVPGYPAAHSASLSNVLSVGAYTSSDRIASFSNRVGGSGATQVDAPGQSIYNTFLGGGYGSLSGTSMATPFVSGVAALAWAANPTLGAGVIRNMLTQSVGAAVSGSDSLGRIDAAAAIPLAISGSVAASVTSSSVRSSSPQSFSNTQRVYALAASTCSDLDVSNSDDLAGERAEDRLAEFQRFSNADRDANQTAVAQTPRAAIRTESVLRTELAALSQATSVVDNVFASEDWSGLETANTPSSMNRWLS